MPTHDNDSPETGHRLALAGALAAGAVLAGCAAQSGAPPPPSAATTVQLPDPQQRGPDVTVEGEVRWTGPHPGCVTLKLPDGQTFQLTGRPVSDELERVRAGTSPGIQRMRLTGYVPPVTPGVCSQYAFLVEKMAKTGAVT
ncbi:hypothetical protein [Amycolatopsis sp. WGS_07]|uniref:hypothetical protein n=1 Tax=Amycolatopsis sp. WGS_07 TaxID=3076764 RepID=UPI003872E2D8